MNPRYQIFVSSTFQDLKHARERVTYELMRNGFIAVGMEQFHASDEEQMEYIRPLIDQTDYYVVILKGRYGSLSADGISYTEKEYRYALEKGVPILAFLYEDMQSLTVQDTDDNPEKLKKFKSFREELSSKRMVSFWKTEDELVSQVKDSVFGIAFRKPRNGWVRGDQALDPQIYKELDVARKRIAELEEKLASQREEDTSFPDDIAHGKDLYSIKGNILRYKKNGQSTELISSKVFEHDISWDDIFYSIIDMLYKEAEEDKIQNSIESEIKKRIINLATNKRETESEPSFYALEINASCIRNIRFQLEALGLITTTVSVQERTLFHSFSERISTVCWCLTEKGRRYIAKLMAIRRINATPPAPQP